MKIYIVKLVEIEKKWILIDVEGVVLGCFVMIVVMCLCGKYKLIFIFYMDMGDNVIIINVDKVQMIGDKCDVKKYYWYIGYLGGIKYCIVCQILEGVYFECVVIKVVECMILCNKLGKQQMINLCVYVGVEYLYEVQQFEVLDVKFMNFKNIWSV